MPEKMHDFTFQLEETTIRGIQEAFDKGVITSKELVLMYLERIAKFDKNGPSINSVLEINPDAIHIAEALDQERITHGKRGLLHGIPVLIKDNINTRDKMHTSAGSLALADSYAPYDAFLVQELRKAGAVILGKANLTELANFMTEGMPAGYSSRGGQVLNPYRPGIIHPGGSSAGSGAAVASNFCTVSVGTETSGSILSPSCQNSIVGIKPTLGLVSRTGIVPIAHSQDTAGPMARTVEDAAILLSTIAGIDNQDPATLTGLGRTYEDYTGFLDSKGLDGARIGVPKDYYWDELSDDEKEIMNESINIMRKLGAEVIESTDITTAKDLESYNVLVYEFKTDMNAYLSSLGAQSKIKTLKDIIDFNNKNPEKTLKYGQSILLESDETSGTLTEKEYILERIKDLRQSQKEGIDKVIEEYSLDAIIFPGVYGADIAARAGYPSIMVPAGYTSEGNPFGVTFTSKAYTEPILIKLAYSFEQGSNKRVAPKW